jgi:hypothetical protein
MQQVLDDLNTKDEVEPARASLVNVKVAELNIRHFRTCDFHRFFGVCKTRKRPGLKSSL